MGSLFLEKSDQMSQILFKIPPRLPEKDGVLFGTIEHSDESQDTPVLFQCYY